MRRLRREWGWNLMRLATETGLPQSTLSKVENGQMSLNYEKLLQVAAALEIDVARLFAAEPDMAAEARARRVVDRNSSDGFHADGHYRYKHMSIELKNRLMGPVLLEVSEKPAGVTDDSQIMMHIIGERFAYVLQGPVDFLCEQYETVTLQTGDSIYVDAAMPHGFVAPAGATARVLTVLASSDPEYMKIVRDAALQGASDASGRFKEMRARNKDTKTD